MPEHLSERALGYVIHTNRELGLMLRGLKPLAHFADVHEPFPDVLLRYLRLFDRHVDGGVFVKREFVQFAGHRRMHRILYALPGEAWRIDAFLDLWLQDGPWSLEHERREGELLGYSDGQNDRWIAHLKAKGSMPPGPLGGCLPLLPEGGHL